MSDDKSVRVLIVDDDRAIRGLLASVCKRLGYSCDEAADGAEALAKLRSTPFDILLLDLMMPRVNGYKVIEALATIDPRPEVIVLTAQGVKQTAGLAENPIVSLLLTKPFDLGQLVEILKAVVVKRGTTTEQ